MPLAMGWLKPCVPWLSQAASLSSRPPMASLAMDCMEPERSRMTVISARGAAVAGCLVCRAAAVLAGFRGGTRG